jgi:preprotein translocase subunit SecG
MNASFSHPKFMNTTLVTAQIIAAILMVLSILLQQRGTGLGTAFGGTGNVYRTKRGIEHVLLWITIVTAFVFVFSSLLLVIF